MKKRIAISIGILSLTGLFYTGDVAAQAGHKPGTMGYMKDMKDRREKMEKDAQDQRHTMMSRMDSLDLRLQEKVSLIRHPGDNSLHNHHHMRHIFRRRTP